MTAATVIASNPRGERRHETSAVLSSTARPRSNIPARAATGAKYKLPSTRNSRANPTSSRHRRPMMESAVFFIQATPDIGLGQIAASASAYARPRDRELIVSSPQHDHDSKQRPLTRSRICMAPAAAFDRPSRIAENPGAPRPRRLGQAQCHQALTSGHVSQLRQTPGTGCGRDPHPQLPLRRGAPGFDALRATVEGGARSVSAGDPRT